MRLNYLPQPGMSSKAGLGLGFAKFGESVAKLGDIGSDEKKRRYNESVENMKLGFTKDANARAEESHALSKKQVQKNIETLDFNLKVMQDAKGDKEAKKKATINVFRTLHPKATKNFNDDEVMAFAEDIDKFLPKNKKIEKLDTRVTPSGNKILTYEQGGKIYEKNLGKVKTDWNSKKASSDIPEGYVSVSTNFFENFGHTRKVKNTGKGYIAPIDFVNQITQEMKKEEATKAEKQKAITYAQKQKELEDTKAFIFGKETNIKDPVIKKKEDTENPYLYH